MTPKPKTQRKKNVAGFYAGGQFHPIRKDRDKYDPQLAGDFDDVFDREIRKQRNYEKSLANYHKQLENAIRREMLGEADELREGQTLMQFVRSHGGIKRSKYSRGNLEFLSFKESGKRGLVSDTKGKTLDYMFQAANEAGYDVSDTNDLLNKLENELDGKPTYKTGGSFDYRRNPTKFILIDDQFRKLATDDDQAALERWAEKLNKKAGYQKYSVIGKSWGLRDNPKKVMKSNKLSSAKIRETAKTLAALFPNQNATDVLKKLKRKNPTPAELAGASIDVFDLNNDGDVDFNDVDKFERYETPEDIVITADGETARVLTATAEDELVLKIIDGDNAGEIEIADQREITLPESPDLAINPAAIAKYKGQWRVILPNGRFLRVHGRIYQTATKARAVEMASKIKLSRADELKMIRQMQAQSRKPFFSNPMHPLSAFANSAVGLASALQIKDYFDKNKKKNPKTMKKTVKNPTSLKPDRGMFNKSIKYVVFHTFIGKRRVNGFTSKAAAEMFANKLKAEKRYKNVQVKPTPSYLIERAKNPKAATAKNPKAKTTAKNPPTAKKATAKNPPKKATARKNPTYKRPAFEKFQGRPSTKFKEMPVSRFAPKSLDTLGRLIEIKLAGQKPISFAHRTRNPLILTTNPRMTRLWIAGGKMARKNPNLEDHQIEVIAPLEYVVYETHKPHIEGDEVERHYIHALGEETGELPEFALDNEGFAVIHGGAYTIEERGIVN